MKTNFYVYIVYRNDGTPCYVGKGQGHRYKHHFTHSHNKWLRRIVTKYDHSISVKKVYENLTNAEASEYEVALIKQLGRADKGAGPLVNFTDGGEGAVGHIWSQQARARIAAALTGRTRPPEVIAKMSAALKGRKPSAYNIERLAVAHRGIPRSPEVRQKISAANLGRTLSAETIARIRAAKLGKPRRITAAVLRYFASRRGCKMPWIAKALKQKQQILADPSHPLYKEAKHKEELRLSRIAAALRRPKTAAEIAANPWLQKGVRRSQEYREKLSRAHKGVKLSSEHVRNSTEAHRGLKRSPETRLRMSLGQKAACARRRAQMST